MYFMHHAAVCAVTLENLRHFLSEYDALHPGVIIHDGGVPA